MDLEVWFKITYSFIEEYFKSYTSRAQGFQSLINDFSFKKILGLTQDDVTKFKNSGIEYLNETLLHLEALKQQQIKAAEEKANILAQIEEQNKNRENIILPEPKSNGENLSSEQIVKTQLPFGISAGLFWTIIAAVISCAFVLGQNFGSTKFDKEKSDYYDELKSLRIDTTNLHQKIALYDSIAKEKDSIILVKQDSLILLNKNLANLYLLLAKQSK